MANASGDAFISQWATPWHGLEALGDHRNILLGVAVVFLAGTLACQYLLNAVGEQRITERARRMMRPLSLLFLAAFLSFLGALLVSTGWSYDASGVVAAEPYKYLHNLLQMPLVSVVMLIGVVLVLASILLGWRGSRKAIWLGGSGTVLTVLALLLCAGWNNTAYYPSLVDMQSSLTIANSSSSEFTLRVMAYVSLLIPFVLAYIWYAWRSLNRRPVTSEELRDEEHSY